MPVTGPAAGGTGRLRTVALLCLLVVLLVTGVEARASEYLVYVGTYTGTGSEGIYAYRFDPATGVAQPLGLVADTDNPSFLAADPKGRFLYVSNRGHDSIAVFSMHPRRRELEASRVGPERRQGAPPLRHRPDRRVAARRQPGLGHHQPPANRSDERPVDADGPLARCGLARLHPVRLARRARRSERRGVAHPWRGMARGHECPHGKAPPLAAVRLRADRDGIAGPGRPVAGHPDVRKRLTHGAPDPERGAAAADHRLPVRDDGRLHRAVSGREGERSAHQPGGHARLPADGQARPADYPRLRRSPADRRRRGVAAAPALGGDG